MSQMMKSVSIFLAYLVAKKIMEKKMQANIKGRKREL
jgi:hypothetical protein